MPESNQQRIYPDEVMPQDNASLLNLLAMIIASESKAIELAKSLLQEPSYQHQEHEFLLSTIETILCYKISHLPREEIWKMINLSYIDITRTLLYQDAKREGRQEEGKSMLMRLLTKHFGKLKVSMSKKIERLSIEELKQLYA